MEAAFANKVPLGFFSQRGISERYLWSFF